MKKALVAVAAVAISAVVQAASFNWSNTGMSTNGVIYDHTASSTKLAEGMTAYLFCVSDITQTALLTAVRADGVSALTGKSIAGATTTVNSSSKIAKTEEFSYGVTGGDYDFYFAILDAASDQLLISDIASAQGQLGSTELVAFSGSKTWSNRAFGEAEYSVAGWYSTVPEPTSGLLLLLGMAGLALKRKVA